MYNKYNNPFQIDDNARSNPNPNVSLARTTRTRYDTLTARATRTEQARASAVRQFDSRPPLLYLRCFYFHLPLSRSTTPGLERSHSLTPDYPAWILRPTDLPPSPSLLPPLGKLTRGGASERATTERERRATERGGTEKEAQRQRERESARRSPVSYLICSGLSLVARRDALAARWRRVANRGVGARVLSSRSKDGRGPAERGGGGRRRPRSRRRRRRRSRSRSRSRRRRRRRARGSRAIFGRAREAHRRRGGEEDRRQLRGEVQPAWSASRDCRAAGGDGGGGGARQRRGRWRQRSGARRALARGGGWDGDGVGWWWMLVAWQPRQIDRRCAARPPLAPRPPPSRVSHRSREPRCDRAFIDAPSFLLLASFCSSRDKLLRVLFSADTRSAGFERKGGGGRRDTMDDDG